MKVNLPQGDNFQVVLPKGNFLIKKRDSMFIAEGFTSNGSSARIAMLLLYFILFTWWLWKNAIIENEALISINYIYDSNIAAWIGIVTMLVIVGLSVLFNFWNIQEMSGQGESNIAQETSKVKSINMPRLIPYIVALLEAIGLVLIWYFLYISVGNGLESDAIALQVIFWCNVSIIIISFLYSLYQYIILRQYQEQSVFTGWFLFSTVILHIAMALVVWLFMPALFTTIF